MGYQHINRSNGTHIFCESSLSDSKNLAVIFSGFDYTFRNPLLYYSTNTFIEDGFDFICYDFKYYDDVFFNNLKPNEKNDYSNNDFDLLLQSLKNTTEKYDRVFFIGKSIGTNIFEKILNIDSMIANSYFILLTPSIFWKSRINILKQIKNRALIIASNTDKNYSEVEWSTLIGLTNIELFEIQKANHSLETGNIDTDIDILKSVLNKIKTFIKE